MGSNVKGPVGDHSKTKVAYYYNEEYANFYYGIGHRMKPNRVRMAHHLIIDYGLYRHLSIYKAHKATRKDLDEFHDPQYTMFLETADPGRISSLKNDMRKFNVGEDCPIFTGLFEFCQLSCGSSIAAATKLNKGTADIAINWMGGASHAKANEASGFCYTNDIVLGILELLKIHKRVLYVDLDIYHGDGVEEAFYTTDRVMTVSFHKYQRNFFPGTGDIKSVGHEEGAGFSVNVPLKDGINDKVYERMFKPIMKKVIERYDPNAIVMQCGADTLTGDKLGSFNLTLKGHGECVRYMRSFKLPMILLGGGGFNTANTSRCWTYETAIACGQTLSNIIPANDYRDYYRPPNLHIHASSLIANQNNPRYLQQIQREVFQNLNALTSAPSVQMQPIPEAALAPAPCESAIRDMADPDQRLPPQVMDEIVIDDGEFYDFEDGSGAFRNEYQYSGFEMYPYDGPSTSNVIYYQ